jgi:toxin ParE1/3/4
MLLIDISIAAQTDIDQIAGYTKSEWGWRQADVYLAKLEDGFEFIAKNPLIGRSCDAIQIGLRRFEVERHVVFYIPSSDTVLIVRVLHERMLPLKRRFVRLAG